MSIQKVYGTQKVAAVNDALRMARTHRLIIELVEGNENYRYQFVITYEKAPSALDAGFIDDHADIDLIRSVDIPF